MPKANIRGGAAPPANVVEPEVSAPHRGFRYMSSIDRPCASALYMWSKVTALRSHLHSPGNSSGGGVTLSSDAELTKLETETRETPSAA